ncbi:hypothetical protein Q0Z83_082360 [Actinoplanes sichuanensis]|uniref:Uncharacterized protein n=1 Tax=Actinoplanes sichuanensis TaxID=512349 RepID=A0ABW4ADW6_9ACTN|nr:hypothetical protein [Actinoplanes sichuanensis]BEL10045.1 hypothetical protein Q0Z83_082360 [Actinoplanes sichuanensis]
MSDKWINAQHAEVQERNRRQREEQMREAQRLADERRAKQGR